MFCSHSSVVLTVQLTLSTGLDYRCTYILRKSYHGNLKPLLRVDVETRFNLSGLNFFVLACSKS